MLLDWSDNDDFGAETIDRITPRFLDFLSNIIVQHSFDTNPEFEEVIESINKPHLENCSGKFAINTKNCVERLPFTEKPGDFIRNIVSAIGLLIERLIVNDMSRMNHLEWRSKYYNLVYSFRPTDYKLNRIVLCRLSTHYENLAKTEEHTIKLKLMVSQLYFFYRYMARRDTWKNLSKLADSIKSYERHERKEWLNTANYQLYENMHLEKSFVEIDTDNRKTISAEILEEHFYLLFLKTFVVEFGHDNYGILINVLSKIEYLDVDTVFQMNFIAQQWYKMNGPENEGFELHIGLMSKIFKIDKNTKIKQQNGSRIVVFGDSMLRGLHNMFQEHNQPVDVICMPGKKVEHVYQRVKLLDMKLKHKDTFFNTEMNFHTQSEEKIELKINSTNDVKTLVFFVGTNDCDTSRETTDLNDSLRIYSEMIDFSLRTFKCLEKIMVCVPLQRMDNCNNRITLFYAGLKLMVKNSWNYRDVVKVVDFRKYFTDSNDQSDKIDEPYLPYYRNMENSNDVVHLRWVG